MRKFLRRVAAVLTAVVIFALSTAALTGAEASAGVHTVDFETYRNYGYAFEVMRLINAERRGRGLSPLKMDYDLLDAAQQRGAEVYVYFSHTRPDGGKPNDLDRSVNGENIAMGQGSPEKVVSEWMLSYVHRKNILTEDYVSTGVAAIKHNGVYAWVQVFGRSVASVASERRNTEATARVRIADGTIRPALSVVVTSSGYEVAGGGLAVGTNYICSLRMRNPGYSSEGVTLSGGVSWSSSDTSKLTVSSSGKVTVKGRGSATITGYSESLGRGAKFYATLTGTVDAEGIEVYKKVSSSRWVSISGTQELGSGDRLPLKVIVKPEDASDRTFCFKSSDTSVAKYDSDGGCIVAVRRGSCKITAYSSGNPEVKKSFNVDVDGGAPKVAVRSVKVQDATIIYGERLTLKAAVSPSDAYDKSVRWKSDSDNIRVNGSSGEITYALAGKAVLTAVSVSDPSVSCSCTVWVKYTWWQYLARIISLREL